MQILGPQAVADFVKQHVKDGLICGLSIDDQNRLLGPSKANTYIRGNQDPDGRRVLKDSCGNRVDFAKMDMMAGNGVVHKLTQALKSPACESPLKLSSYLALSFIHCTWS